MMAFIQAEDMSGLMELFIFPKTLQQFSNILKKDALLVFEGRISAKEEDTPKILVSNVMTFDELEKKIKSSSQSVSISTQENKDIQRNSVKLYLRFDSEEEKILINRVSAILRIFHGNIPVHFYYSDIKKNVLVPEALFASSEPYLKTVLQNLLGTENVVYKS